MWSKGAQKDYLDVYDDYEGEEVDYYEEETKVEEKVEVKPVEVRLVEVKPVEVKSEADNLQYDYDSEFSEEYDNYKIKKTKVVKNNLVDVDELLFDDVTCLSKNTALYRMYKEYNSIQNIVNRFGFKKLKSNDKNIYYLDRVLYFIWKYHKNPITNEEELVKPDDKVYDTLRKINYEETFYDRYLGQPQIYF